jgi:AcrR family transcriptional regulator
MTVTPASAAKPMRKGERTRLAMLQAAVDILDEQGPDALTLQALGERLGLHRTAIYRHFADRDDLLGEALEYLIAQVAVGLNLPADPRGRIATIALELRRMFHRYPGASTIFVTTGGSRAGSAQMEVLVLQALREMGVAEADLPVVYQALESYTIGASLFDFAGAPLHLESRRERHAAVADPAMARVTASAVQVDATNEAAFLWGLQALLDRIDKKSHSR